MRRGFTWLELLIVIVIIGTIAMLGVHPNPFDCFRHRAVVAKKKSEDNLRQLYTFMRIYEQNFGGRFPSMQRTNMVPRCNGGVRDLYPLYRMAKNMIVDGKVFLYLFRPPDVALIQFSDNPGPDEFDKDHIGYIYNSAVVPDQSNTVPLMAERCVEDGMFTADEKPVFKDCAHILMSDGTVRQLPVENGKLILPSDIKVEDLGKLK